MKTKEKIETLLSLAGLTGVSTSVDEENHRLNILVDEGEWFKSLIPNLIKDIKHIANLIAKKNNEELYAIDVNNYRKERERLIVEIAKAAAQKAVAENEPVQLPAMNSYERRLVHVELAMRPDVETESVGESLTRAVIVKPSKL